jgi:REP element-mobilizing transposase RayT
MNPSVDQLVAPADFIGFDPRLALRNYKGNLPYWTQAGASYFMTFRLNDALPNRVIDQYLREQEAWRVRLQFEREQLGDLAGETGQEYEAFQIRAYRSFETILDEGLGSCVFKDPIQRQIVTEVLLQFHGDHYMAHSFVVMPNHLHLVVKPLDGQNPENLLLFWMKAVALRLGQNVQVKGGLWHVDTWIRMIRNEEHWLRAMRYTLKNPEHAKLPHGQSTVWWDSGLFDLTRSLLREDCFDEPW